MVWASNSVAWSVATKLPSANPSGIIATSSIGNVDCRQPPAPQASRQIDWLTVPLGGGNRVAPLHERATPQNTPTTGFGAGGWASIVSDASPNAAPRAMVTDSRYLRMVSCSFRSRLVGALASELEIEANQGAQQLIRFVERAQDVVVEVGERPDQMLPRDIVARRFRRQEREDLHPDPGAEMVLEGGRRARGRNHL